MTTDNYLDTKISIRNSTNFVSIEDLTIVIPTLNEELAIGKVINEIMDEGYINLLVIDGHSSDNTVEIATKFGVSVIKQHGKGKTGAIITAIEHIKTEFFIVIDGDYTYNPKDIELFLPHLRNYNEIIGSRKNGKKHMPRLNRFGNWVINKTFNILFGTSLSDVCSGLYAINTAFAKNLILETNGFDVEVEIAAHASRDGRISEIPISYGKRIGSRKLSPLKDGFQIMKTILSQSRRHHSILFYTLLSTLMIVPSTLILGWVLIEYINGTWHSGLALLGVLFILLTSEAVMLNVIASQQRALERRILNKLASNS